MAATAAKVKDIILNPDEERFTICLPNHNAKIAQFAYYQAENNDSSPSGEELESWFETEIGLSYCHDKIAELAFYSAERRGFAPDHELDDWLEAERDFLL